MQLKKYQERVIRQVKTFLDALAREQAAAGKHPSLDAWNEVKNTLAVTGNYQERQNGLGKDLPTFCIKVPTGGGKTLLATQFLGAIHQTILKTRNGAGLVLWVVPSDQIYKDTLKALRDRRHFYRESLEFALSRRLEVWEKHEIARLTPGQLANNLNILMLMLPSTNRQVKESLKFFRDTGGNIVQHFPPENESQKHKELKERVPNLDMLAEDAERGEYLARTSVGNLVRLCEPAIILDEGHKVTSELARKTIEGFNASVIVELTATPPADANVLVRVSGQDLLDEQMIKLPINIATSRQKSWKECLTQARDKRLELAKLAERHYRATGKLIRPIVLVQVQRTGKDQREAPYVHSLDVKEHLMQKLDVPEIAIALKTAQEDDIELLEKKGIPLLDDGCPVEWIITKGALQEGWDCPFAYILVSLNNTGSQQSMTQLVGRVLRQPDVTKTDFDELNESYVFCIKQKAEDIVREVKKALEQEGYEGEAASVVDQSGDSNGLPRTRTASIRKDFKRHYRKPFEGQIYLPRFCVKNGKKDYEGLDWFRHLLSRVDVTQFNYADTDWNLASELRAAKEFFYRVTLGQENLGPTAERQMVSMEADSQVQAWMIANLPFSYYSFRQLGAVVSRVCDRLLETNSELAGKLALVKFEVVERIKGLIERETDRQTEIAFKRLFDEKKLCFFLECVECRFEVPPQVELRCLRQLVDEENRVTERSLFDFVANDLNTYEKKVALYLDKKPEVLWWYRNLVGRENFSIQGFRRQRIYPDFVVQAGRQKKPLPKVLVVESKGKHLKGNEDTKYKRTVADYFDKIGRKVTWQELGEGFENHQFRFQILDEGDYEDRDWKEELRGLLEEAAS